MNNYDLIAFDMDGTILTSNQTVSVHVQEAIAKAKEKGKTVIICTGRAPKELTEYDKVEFENIRYYVCENGALIYDSQKEKVISARCIPEHLVRQVLEAAKKEDCMVVMACSGQNTLSEKDAVRMEYFHAERYKKLELLTGKLLEDIIESYMENPVPVEKINVYSASVEIRDRIMEHLKDLPITMVYAEETGFEVTQLHMSKAVGFTELCEYLKIPVERAIAVGDSDNDVEMLKVAGLSVAMGNAFDHVKEICHITVSDNDHDGCAEVIEKYLLNE